MEAQKSCKQTRLFAQNSILPHYQVTKEGRMSKRGKKRKRKGSCNVQSPLTKNIMCGWNLKIFVCLC